MKPEHPPSEIHTDATFRIPPASPGHSRILLLNPPVYDAQYWARWSQPAGLLRIATLLKEKGYSLDLVDCMETDEKGMVPRSRRLVDGKPYIEIDDIRKQVWHFGLRWDEIEKRMAALDPPHEVWIASIMTYWWESTRDAVSRARRLFPGARILVGGIYPTLASEHAAEHLGADVIFKGEISEASELPTDLSLYQSPPTYAILTTSRGCPWDCHYCAARSLNGGSDKMRARDAEDVLAEIEDKARRFGIRRFGFYEDNALVLRGHLQGILERIIDRNLKLDLYAPEGFETRFLTPELMPIMRKAGFRKIHLPFEALRFDTNLGWNRRHASTASFDQALEAAKSAGYRPRTEDLNAVVLFGLPDENLQDILDSVLYVHHTVGSIVPMLFTPVPGTHIYNEHRDYLHRTMGWDLERLNGKFLPFLEYNRRKNYRDLRASDYMQLETLMSILNNGKFLSGGTDICGDGRASRVFRSAALGAKPDLDHALSTRNSA